MTRLIHYSDRRIDKLQPPMEYHCKILEAHREYRDLDPEILQFSSDVWIGCKPQGLWVSAEEDEEAWRGWKNWCLSEEFRKDCLQFSYEVVLRPDAAILWISTPEQIDELTQKHKKEPLLYRRLKMTPDDIKEAMGETVHELDWNPIREKYKGIVISPYQWTRRLEGGTMWYYGWDCASGCIWDISCVEEFRLVCGPLEVCRQTQPNI